MLRLVQGDGAVVERGVDELALARAVALVERHQDAHAGIHAGRQIDHRHADSGGACLWITIDTHQTAHGLENCIVARQVRKWAGVAKARDTAVNELWKGLGQMLIVAKSPFCHCARDKIFD